LRRNCLLKQIIEGEMDSRRGRQLQADLKEMRGNWKLKDKAVDRTLRRKLALEEAMDLS
jgi:hypothetical protein